MAKGKLLDVCSIIECNNQTSAKEYNNLNYNRQYCSFHVKNGVEINCQNEECNTIFFIALRYYEPGIKRKCRTCINRENAKKVTVEGHAQRIQKMKDNGSYDKWQNSCHSKESKIIGYKTMTDNGNVKNLIEASNKPDVLKRKQESRIKSGSFDKFMLAGRDKTKWLWANDQEYRKNQFKNNLKSFPAFKTENGIKYYYDRSAKSYILWSDFKSKFANRRLTRTTEAFLLTLKNSKIFKYTQSNDIFLQSTFRVQDSENWSGAKSALEQALVENDIHWFTYIKFYIDSNNKIRPLVVGKSGSLNVNSSGSDISFSTELDHGPARQFLFEENLDWNKTQVLIIKAKSEKQALFFENRIAFTFRLFES